MRTLVTGGAGYIGSVITEILVGEGHEVTVLDDLSKGHRSAIPKGARFVHGEIQDSQAVKEALTRNRIEAVIHMAAWSLVGESVRNPREYYRNNVEATLALINAMCDSGVMNLVFSSTAATYGEPLKQPVEESDPTSPTNPYGETKLAIEKALEWYSKAYSLRYTSLRYFNAAGATKRNGEVHDPESHLIPLVLQVAAGKRPHVEIYGSDYPTRDGSCVRDYVHVVDLARAHILSLTRQDPDNCIFNLGCGGNGYSVFEVVDVARKITGHPIPIRVVARRAGDPAVLIAASSRIDSQLGWQPQFQDLHVIIESAWKWMQFHPNGYQD